MFLLVSTNNIIYNSIHFNYRLWETNYKTKNFFTYILTYILLFDIYSMANSSTWMLTWLSLILTPSGQTGNCNTLNICLYMIRLKNEAVCDFYLHSHWCTDLLYICITFHLSHLWTRLQLITKVAVHTENERDYDDSLFNHPEKYTFMVSKA